MKQRWMSGTVLLTLLCMVCVSAVAQPMHTEASIDPTGLIIGVSAVQKPDDTQLDLTRNIRVYTWIYNNTPTIQAIDWRTRRLRSKKISAYISDHDFYGVFLLQPGEIKFMHSFFYYKTGFPGKFTFSVRDDGRRVYEVACLPQATNKGPFATLPVPLQHHVIDACLNDPTFKWWYREY